MRALFLLFSFSLTINYLACAQSSGWKNSLQTELADFKNCMSQEENSKCRTILGKSIKLVYGINDFYDKASGSYSTAQDIASTVGTTTAWKSLGFAYKQEVLTQSQELANQNKPVLAVYKSEDGGAAHAVLVLPGELKTSGSWNLQVPLVASFFTHDPEKSFVDKSLAYAFSKTMLLRIELYARN